MYVISTYPMSGRKLFEFCDELKKQQMSDIGLELFYDNIPFYSAKYYSEWLGEYFKGGKLGMHCPMEGCCLLAPKGSLKLRYTLDKHIACFELAQEIGSSYVVIHTNSLEPRSACEASEQKKLLGERMSKTAELAKKYRLKISVENVGFGYNNSIVAEQDDFLKLTENSDYDMLLDIGHAHANGWNIPMLIDTLGSRIAGFHFHDNDGSSDSHIPIGKGTAKWNEIFAAIKRSAPSADRIIEYSPKYCGDITNGIRFLQSMLDDILPAISNNTIV